VSKYQDVDLKEIEYLIQIEGYSNEKLIKHLGISVQTFYNWKKTKVEFLETLKKSRQILVNEIKNKLLEKVRGIEYTERYEEKKQVVVSGEIVILKTTREVTKFIPPSDAAIFFSLANLDPKNWKRTDKEVKEEDKEDKIIIPHTTTKEELRKRIESEDF